VLRRAPDRPDAGAHGDEHRPLPRPAGAFGSSTNRRIEARSAPAGESDGAAGAAGQGRQTTERLVVHRPQDGQQDQAPMKATIVNQPLGDAPAGLANNQPPMNAPTMPMMMFASRP
jgi:hypothetical protein